MSRYQLGKAQTVTDAIVVGVDSEGDSLVWVLVELVFQSPVAGLTHHSGSTLVTADSDVYAVLIHVCKPLSVVDPVKITFLIRTKH